ncbi:MAG TPA: hypothetical protein VK994_06670 [Bacteroidales bacterium]|nr:hypothetical protein [Bacteroidales bacterium]
MKAISILFTILFFLSFNIYSQDEQSGLPTFDSYESMKELHPGPLEAIPLEAGFFKGSVVIEFQDGSVITPEGVMIELSRVYPGDKAKLVNKAISDAKGTFYLKGMSTGDYKIEVAFKGNLVLTKYFSIVEPNGLILSPLVVPVENIEKREIQRQQYQAF